PVSTRRKVLPDAISAAAGRGDLDRGIAREALPASECLRRAVARLSSLQRTDGSFEGEAVWCPMILAPYVMWRSFVRRPIAAAEQARMRLHFERTQLPDGGWGLHPEAPPYVFVTTLSYVALRLLGMPANAAPTARARDWLRAQAGGVLA